jgi:hypothetical protein
MKPQIASAVKIKETTYYSTVSSELLEVFVITSHRIAVHIHPLVISSSEPGLCGNRLTNICLFRPDHTVFER